MPFHLSLAWFTDCCWADCSYGASAVLLQSFLGTALLSSFRNPLQQCLCSLHRVLRSTFKPLPCDILDKTSPDIAGYNAVAMKLPNSKNPEVWEQWDWVWHFSAYGLLILNIIFVYNSDPRIINFSFFLILCAVLGLWYIPFVNISTLRIWDNPK